MKLPERQLSLFPECTNERCAPLHRGQSPTRHGRQVREILGAEVRQFMLFKVRPEVLDGVQLRGVGRQTLDLKVFSNLKMSLKRVIDLPVA